MTVDDVLRALDERVALDALRLTPSPAARRVARRALEVRASLPPSRRGGLSTTEAGRQGVGSGVKRAQDIAAGHDVDAMQVHRFCSRFRGKVREARRRGLTLPESRALQAWDHWGGDPLCAEAAEAVRGSIKR